MSGKRSKKKSKLIDQKISSGAEAMPNHHDENQHDNRPDNRPDNRVEYHDDYDDIKSAVLETKRGRWFLTEFARKNKVVESQLVLDGLTKIENKLGDQPVELKKAPSPEIVAPAPPILEEFETEQQSTQFGQLFANFKQKTNLALKWAGVKNPLEFSKIQTIVNFATFQSRVSLQGQEKKLTAIIAELKNQNINKKTLSQLTDISTELKKLEVLQGNLNSQLENGLKFMSEAEKIAQNMPANLAVFDQKPAGNSPKNDEKTPKNLKKNGKNLEKTAKNDQKTPEIAPKTPKIVAKKTRLGPAGRIKKMFKIEQTLQTQLKQDLAEPAKAFDAAFADERVIMEQDLDPDFTTDTTQKPAQPSPKPEQSSPKIEQQTEKLAAISATMKQAETTENTGSTQAQPEPEIIIDEDFNALNSLALLSKTERTMLFTLQH